MLDTTIRKHTQIRHVPSYKQLGVKTNRTSFLCGNRNGIQNVTLLTIDDTKNWKDEQHTPHKFIDTLPRRHDFIFSSSKLCD